MATVLIADHDESLRRRIAEQVRALGFEVVDGDDRLELETALAERDFALAILSAGDPIDGAGALASMRARGDRRPVVMILNELKAVTFAPMMRLGACGYLLRTQADADIASQLRKALRLPVAPPAAINPATATTPSAAVHPTAARASTTASISTTATTPTTTDGSPGAPRRTDARHSPASMASQPIAKGDSIADAVQHARALLVGFDEVTAPELVARLRNARIEAFVPPEPKAPYELFHRDDRFVAVIARLGGLAPGEIEQLKNLVYSRPSLAAVIAAGAAHGSDVAEFQRLKVRRVVAEPALPADLAVQLIDSLSEHHLDLEAVRFLEQSVVQVLRGSPLVVQPSTPHFRVNSRLLAPIAGIIEVAGPEFMGRLIVSGDPLVLTRLARQWLGELPPTRHLVWDAAGELTNRVAGLLRGHYRSRGFTSTQSPPLVLEGVDTEVSQLTHLPSIVFTFEVARPAGQIFVEWHLAAPARPPASRQHPDADAASVAQPGELNFL